MSVYSQTVQEVDTLQKSVIKVDRDRKIANVDERIYSGFVEHLGRCIYGGLVDYLETPKTEVNSKGYRKDVTNAIKDLNMPVVRWPGGNFVSSYHWIDGVGPKEDRPRRPELAWLGEESNQFGTDEFLDWCSEIGCEPYFCLNMGTGTLDEALAWIEYCNSSKNTYYANLRRKNGHEEPYNVKYWGLGNEVWGPWQVGQMTMEDYAKKAAEWAKAIKLLDPNVELVSCGCTGVASWDFHVLDKMVNWVDFHSIHIYTGNSEFLKNVTAPAAAETAIQVTKNLIDLARIQNPLKNKKPKICFDEWNVWDPERADGTKGAEEQYNLGDGLAVASWLNLFVRQSEALGMCNIAQLVNVIAPIMTNDSTLFFQPTYYPLKLFSNFMRNGYAINLHVESLFYKGPTGNNDGTFKWIEGNTAVPFLDVSAVQRTDSNTTFIAIVNRSLEEDASTKVFFDEKIKSIKKWFLCHEDVYAFNTFEDPENVNMFESEIKVQQENDLSVTFEFPKHSFTFLRVDY